MIYYAVLAFLTFGVAFQTVIVGSHHIDYGHRISMLEQRKRQLTNQTLEVEQQTAKILSMTTLSQDAKELGFVPIQRIVRVDTNMVVASR